MSCEEPAMSYAVKEIFYTLQGEGAQTGRAAVFCRFAGCNLWSGREEDRATAMCQFCDTEFVGVDGPDGGRFETRRGVGGADRGELAGSFGVLRREGSLSSAPEANRCCNWTGRSSMRCIERGFEVAVETNGTIAAPMGSIGYASVPKLARSWCSAQAMNSSWSIRRPARRRRAMQGWRSGTSSCSRWMARCGRPTRSRRCATASSIPRGA